MKREVGQRHKIGIIRAVKGLPTPDEQRSRLIDFGIEDRAIWTLKPGNAGNADDIVKMFRSDPGDDLLVVVHCGVLGSDFDDLLARIGEKGAELYELEKGGDPIPLEHFKHYRYVRMQNIQARSAAGREAAKASGNKPGPKPKPKAFMDKAQRLWETREAGSNREVAATLGVSEVWLNRTFGPRGEAVERAAKK